MATVLTPAKPKAPARTEYGGRDGKGGFGGPGDPGGDNNQWESSAWSVPARTYRTGMWMALAAIVMLFAAFTSALVVRKGMSNDWVPTALPHILYLNTLILLASSLTLELSRRSLAVGFVRQFEGWLYATAMLGMTFIAGQLIAWRELASRGVYLATNPSSSFFYLLTAAHGVHLLGGIAALLYLVFRARTFAGATVAAVSDRRRGSALGERRYRAGTIVGVTAIYWHFMDGLWIYILLLLMVRS